jgi:hypothetical protein
MTISFDDFIKEWTGKPVDFDGVYPNQCMDLMHQYAYEVLGITDKTVLATPAAYQVYTQFKWGDYFTKIDNTPTGVPLKGDLLFFGTGVGAYGHVCIFINGNVNSFNSFDANWPTGTLPHIQTHNYNGVLGWLHPINQPQMTVEQVIKDYETKLASKDQECQQKLKSLKAEVVKKLNDLASQYT